MSDGNFLEDTWKEVKAGTNKLATDIGKGMDWTVHKVQEAYDFVNPLIEKGEKFYKDNQTVIDGVLAVARPALAGATGGVSEAVLNGILAAYEGYKYVHKQGGPEALYNEIK